MGIYDFIEVTINGQKVKARPVEFEGDPDSPTPTRYHTTCPECVQLVDFATEAIDPGSIVVCPACDSAKVFEAQDTPEIINPTEIGLFPTDNIDMDFLPRCEN